ncbi:carcinoembryonic antigen-related cell adhesion molecule 2-like [Neoarius graeffei]|uniref:carcinoembryonic antigen-related cell adhesion molecule 2-like n=1 Tax=Neoarius graeffei TaxID=443677 RepID=UPI00298BD81D|nr:carcinoembryonic antigen-related cell adhesion molecule 2-like [Neoarius graeffei]
MPPSQLVRSETENIHVYDCVVGKYLVGDQQHSHMDRFSQEQNLLPPGPINQAVGENVLFVTLPSPQPLSAIRWHFKSSEVVTYIHPGPVTVNLSYVGRVILNYSTGALELKNLTMADTGEYQLTLTYANGIGHKDHTLLQVFEPVFGLGITSPEGNVIEFGSANFTCKGNGTITNTIWMKGNEILAPSSSITFLDDSRTMMISPVKRSDSGNYHCEINNPVSSSKASFSITVNYGPDVRILGASTLEVDSDILLYCSTDSVPPAIVTWTMKGMSIGNTPLYFIVNSNPSNSGDYNCTGWNNVTGLTVSAVHVLTVKVM